MDFSSQIFNNALCDYRTMYGCEHVLLKVIDLSKNALDSNNFAGTTLNDPSKAFDNVPHELLITKLKEYGLTDDDCRLVSSSQLYCISGFNPSPKVKVNCIRFDTY